MHTNHTDSTAGGQRSALLTRREIIESVRIHSLADWIVLHPESVIQGEPSTALKYALMRDTNAGPRWHLLAWPDDGYATGFAVETDPPHSVDPVIIVEAYHRRGVDTVRFHRVH